MFAATRRKLWLLAGHVSVLAGTIGIFLPLLPTTPFLLLAAVCYERSSPRLRQWLYANRYLRYYLDHYREGSGVPLAVKVQSLACLWLMLGLSALFWHNICYYLLLLAVGIGVSLHLLLLRGCRQRPPAFTLVELLVCIALITLLGSLLLPGLSGARVQARSIHCRNNLRQLATANILYAVGNDDFFVPYSTGDVMDADGQLWLGYQKTGSREGYGQTGPSTATTDLTCNPLLGPYLSHSAAVLICPSVTAATGDFTQIPYGGGYGYNAVWLGRYVVNNQAFSLRSSQMVNPAGVIMFGDNARATMGPFEFDPPQLSPFMYCRERPAALGGSYLSGTIQARHREQANIAWSDGHATSEPLTMPNHDRISLAYHIGHLGSGASDPYRAL